MLRFAEPLPSLVLSGKKNTTWRINDDKDLQPGDILSCCFTNNEEFAKAIITSVKHTTFQHLTQEDKQGHESFLSEEEMYKTYTGYYNFQVTPETLLKVIKFKILKE